MCQSRVRLETRCDFLIKGLWESQTDAIIDVIFGDTDADAYNNEPVKNILAHWEREKNTSTGSTVTSNEDNFPYFPSQWMKCLGRITYY